MLFKIRNLLLLVFLYIGFFSTSQTQIDSILNVIEKTDDPDKVKLYNQLADEYYYANEPSLSIKYYLQTAKYSLENIDSTYHYAITGYGNAAYVYHETSQHKEALKYSKLHLKYAKLENDTVEMTSAYTTLSVTYQKLGDYKNAVFNTEQSLNLNKKANLQEYLVDDYSNLGKIYLSWEKHSSALEYFKKSLVLSQKLNLLNKIALCYSSIGMTYKRMQLFDSTIVFLNKALEIDKKNGNDYKVAIRQSNLASTYFELNEFEAAEENYVKAIDVFKKLKKDYSLCISLNDYAELKFKQNKLTQSKELTKNSLSLARKIGSKRNARSNLFRLSQICAQENKHKEAYSYFKEYSIIHDSLFNEESLQTISNLEVKYYTEKFENENEKLKSEAKIKDLSLQRRKILLITTSIIAFLIIILSIALYNKNKTKAKNNKLLSEKNHELEVLNATKDKFFSIISHDLKNPLSAFKNITSALNDNFENITKEDIKYYISELNTSSGNINNLLADLLLWAKTQLGKMECQLKRIDLDQEINKTTELLQANADAKQINLIKDIPDNVQIIADKEMLQIVLRNLVSNAIKFTPQSGKVKVTSDVINEEVKISVIDSGIGISEKDIVKLFKLNENTKTIGNSPEKGTGLGLILCKEMMDKCDGKLLVESELGKGSSFSFTLQKA